MINVIRVSFLDYVSRARAISVSLNKTLDRIAAFGAKRGTEQECECARLRRDRK